MLTEVQLFLIATAASVIVWGLRQYKGNVPAGVLTTGVYVVSLVLAFFFARPALPPFPPFSDASTFAPLLIAWLGDLLIVLSALAGFATLIYNVLLKAVLEKYVKPLFKKS